MKTLYKTYIKEKKIFNKSKNITGSVFMNNLG